MKQFNDLFKRLKKASSQVNMKNLKRKKPTGRQMLKAARVGAIAAAAGLVLTMGMFVVYARDLPDPNNIELRAVSQSTKIYDRENKMPLYEIHGEVKRTLIPFEEIPEHVKQATIALEDKDFYKHKGIDFTGVARAFTNVLATRSFSQGGSSITQQLVKNALLTREKRVERKIKEAILTVQIEKRYSKDDILRMYLNEIPYGYNAYGIEAAAQTYFGKNAKDLSLAESAYLAALPQRPSYFNPFGSRREALDNRKNLALQKMNEQGYITTEQMNQAKSEQVGFDKNRSAIKAPHFVMYIQELLEEKYGQQALEEGGFRVVTTLDYDLQKKAEETIAENVNRITNYGATNAGLVAVDPKTGEVLAMVGSKDFFDVENQGQVNIATRNRQPGSSFKPYVYAAAFEEGYSPASMLVDVTTSFGNYTPQNYTGAEFGAISMRQALAGSLNIAAVKTLYLAGVGDSINLAKKMGITSNMSVDTCGLSLVLGGCEVKLLDHTAAFGVFANGGVKHETTAILRIEDSKGDVVFEKSQSAGEQVLSPESAYLISDVLSDNSARSYIFGGGSPLQMGNRPVAAKSGTTQNWRDGWTVGYTPQLSTGVWVGNMNGKLMKAGADGTVVAGPIWNSFMRKAHQDKPIESFSRPSGVVDVEVDKVSGLLPTTATPERKTEKFSSLSAPQESDPIHVLVKVNRENGLLATTQTPPELVETRLFHNFRSERSEDPAWENPVRRWAQNKGYQYPPTEKDGTGDLLTLEPGNEEKNSPDNTLPGTPSQMTILSPKSGDVVNGKTTIDIQASQNINTKDLSLYLSDSKGSITRLSGDIKSKSSSGTKTIEFIWTPSEDLAPGTYYIYAALKSGVTSNNVNIYLQ